MTLEFIEVNNTIKSKETIETMYELTMEFYTSRTMATKDAPVLIDEFKRIEEFCLKD